MKRTRRTTAACALIFAMLAAPGAAEAKNYGVDGHVLAPPTASKGRLVVPVLLTERAERRMRLGTGLVRLSLPGRSKLPAPAPSGRGTVAIPASTLRAGDQLKASAPLSRKVLRRLRKRAVPGFRVHRSRVARRASALSTDELTRIVGGLGRQLGLLSGRVDSLAALLNTRVGNLQSHFESTTGSVNMLTTTIGTLETSLAQFLDRVALLEGAVPNAAELLQLQGSVTSLLSRVTSVETLNGGLASNLDSLTSTVTGLQGNLTGLGGQIDAVTSTVNGLGTRLTSAETALAQLPSLIAQVSSLDGSLLAVVGRVDTVQSVLTSVDSSLTGLTGTVNGLTTTTNGLTSTVTQQNLDLAALGTTVGTLSSNLTGVQSGLSTLQGTVGGLQTTVGGLSSQVTGLSSNVAALCGSPLLLGICL